MNMNSNNFSRIAAMDRPSPDDIRQLAGSFDTGRPDAILDFQGPDRFLSNFYDTPIVYEGIPYKNAEAAFQAQKAKTAQGRMAYSSLSASAAKRQGRREDLRPDWEDVKITEMYRIVRAKFTQSETLAWRLLDTGDKPLVEGNTWNDVFWGVCRGKGENWLGVILMAVRNILRSACN